MSTTYQAGGATRRDLRHTPVAEDFIAARMRRGGRRPRTFEAPSPEVLELRRRAVELACIRARATREARS